MIRKWGSTSHLLIGKPSNIAVVKYVAAYVIRTGEELARRAGTGATFRNSFKKGFAGRIAVRAKEEIARAKSGGLSDSATGKALVVAPLYEQTKRDIDRFMLEQDLKPKMQAARSIGVSDQDGFRAGRAAADTVSLRGDAVGQAPMARIAGG
jgi:hypothetical protein